MNEHSMQEQNDENLVRDSNTNSENQLVQKKEEVKPLLSFLKPTENMESIFYHQSDPSSFNIKLQNDSKKTLLFNIIIESDINSQNKALSSTLQSICSNIYSFTILKIGISYENAIVFVFINKISDPSNSFFNKEEEYNKLQSNEDFLMKSFDYIPSDDKHLNVMLLAKNCDLTSVSAMKFYYTQILPKFKNVNANEIIYSCTLKAGIEFKPNDLADLIFLSTSLESCSVVVPAIEANGFGIYGKVQQYENVHYNIYDLNYYDISCYVPVDSRCNIMCIDDELFNKLYEYYDKVCCVNSSIGFTDMNLSLYFLNQNINVFYIGNISAKYTACEIDISEYIDNYTQRHGGILANIYDIWLSFIDFTNCKSEVTFSIVLKKILQIFVIIGLLFDLLLPSIFVMVAFTIFIDGFELDNDKGRLGMFFTIFLALLFLFAGLTALITPHAKKIPLMNNIMHITFEIYYLFLLIMVLVAIIHVHDYDYNVNIKYNTTNYNTTYDNSTDANDTINDNSTYTNSIICYNSNKNPFFFYGYKFNLAACISLILVNFILGIIPMCVNINKIIENIINMFIYLFIGASSSTSICHMRDLFNLTDMMGGDEGKKSIYLLCLLLANTFIDLLLLLSYSRKRRVHTVLCFAAIFTVYNIIKMAAITINIIIKEKKYKDLLNSGNKYGYISRRVSGEPYKGNAEFKGVGKKDKAAINPLNKNEKELIANKNLEIGDENNTNVNVSGNKSIQVPVNSSTEANNNNENEINNNINNGLIQCQLNTGVNLDVNANINFNNGNDNKELIQEDNSGQNTEELGNVNVKEGISNEINREHDVDLANDAKTGNNNNYEKVGIEPSHNSNLNGNINFSDLQGSIDFKNSELENKNYYAKKFDSTMSYQQPDQSNNNNNEVKKSFNQINNDNNNIIGGLTNNADTHLDWGLGNNNEILTNNNDNYFTSGINNENNNIEQYNNNEVKNSFNLMNNDNNNIKGGLSINANAHLDLGLGNNNGLLTNNNDNYFTSGINNENNNTNQDIKYDNNYTSVINNENNNTDQDNNNFNKNDNENKISQSIIQKNLATSDPGEAFNIESNTMMNNENQNKDENNNFGIEIEEIDDEEKNDQK